MRMALRLARKCPGLPYPNPWVGCVIVRDGRVVGKGFHHGAGTNHAEIEALTSAGPQARGQRLAEAEGEGLRMWIDAPPEILRYCIEKGSVAVDGVSLAVAALDETGFEVALVAYTLAETGLGTLPAGDEVNLEADVLGKYVERLLAQTREA